MTQKLKELIETAPACTSGLFYDFLIVSGEKYNGFWGENDYNCMIILGRKSKKLGSPWYKITDCVDVMTFWNQKVLRSNEYVFNADIPTEYGVPRIWFSEPVEINYDGTSSLIGEYIEGYKA